MPELDGPTLVTRRQMIQSLGGGLGALGLANLLAPPAAAATRPTGTHYAPRSSASSNSS